MTGDQTPPLPDPRTFLSGESGHVAGIRRRTTATLGDVALDLGQRLARTGSRLDRLAAPLPARRVLVLCIYRADAARARAAAADLRASRHDVTLAFGALGPADPELAEATVAADLAGGKFENLNAVLDRAGAAREEADWMLVVDDDVLLPPRFLDRFLALCEHFSLDLAQPAQTLRSHAAWRVTRRRPRSLVRETDYVEIGPVTAFAARLLPELLPFPPLRFGWGLDLHWGALARERGWRLGIVDALPVRHDVAPVARDYSHAGAVREEQRFLAEVPYVTAAEAQATLRTHRRIS